VAESRPHSFELLQLTEPPQANSRRHVVHDGSRALGGLGRMLVEATAALPEGRISPAIPENFIARPCRMFLASRRVLP